MYPQLSHASRVFNLAYNISIKLHKNFNNTCLESSEFWLMIEKPCLILQKNQKSKKHADNVILKQIKSIQKLESSHILTFTNNGYRIIHLEGRQFVKKIP